MAEEEESEESKVRKAMARRMREAQLEEQRKEVMRRYLTTEAYERLMNVRVSNYDLYRQLSDLIIAMVQSNRVVSKLTESQLKTILAKLTNRPEPSISFRHK